MFDDRGYFVEPTVGRATRNPKTKNAATARGSKVFGGIEVYHESELERYAANILWADHRTWRLESQYPRVMYRSVSGKIHHHTFDLFVTRKDGWRVAYAVKPSNRCGKLKRALSLFAEAGHVAREGGERLLDEVVIMTEKEACLELHENALNIIRARELHIPDEYQRVRRIAWSLPGRFRFGELMRGSVDESSRSMAIWQMIGNGELVACNHERLFDHSLLTRAA